MSENQRFKFNISILGEATVGKTCIVCSYLGEEFNESKLSTIGVDSVNGSAVFDGKKCIYKIYDTAGQDRFNSIASSTIKLSDGFILVYSVDKKDTLDKISKWIKNIENNVNIDEKIIILVGNKIDAENREVTADEAKIFAKENNMIYFEASAKTGFGIKEIFDYIYKEIYELNKKSKVEIKENNNDNYVNNHRGSFHLKKIGKENDKKRKNCC